MKHTMSIKTAMFTAAIEGRFTRHTTPSTEPGSRERWPAMPLSMAGLLKKCFAIVALSLGVGVPATVSAANSCVQPDGHVVSDCTLDANYKGSQHGGPAAITITNNATLDCAGHYVLGSAKLVPSRKDSNVLQLQNGIDIIQNGVTVKNCNVLNGGTGIWVNKAQHITLINNKVQRSYGDGIDLNESDDISIQNSIVSENGDEGIDVDFSKNVKIDMVTVLHNGYTLETNGANVGEPMGHGIAANSSDVVIRFCDVLFNAKWGLDIDLGTVALEFTNFYNNVRGSARENKVLFKDKPNTGNNRYWLASTVRTR